MIDANTQYIHKLLKDSVGSVNLVKFRLLYTHIHPISRFRFYTEIWATDLGILKGVL